MLGIELFVVAGSFGGEAVSPAKDAVRQALVARAEGDPVRQADLLGRALLVDPESPPAHWQKGLVPFRSNWRSVEQVADELAKDALESKYQAFRARFPADLTPEQHQELVEWCRRAGYTERSAGHQRVLNWQSPTAESTGDQARTERTRQVRLEAERVDRHWRQRLLGLRRDLSNSAKMAQATETVRAIRDPLAIPALETIFSAQSQDLALLTVDVLSAIPHQSATTSLVRHVMGHDSQEVRDAATNVLRERPWDTFIPELINALSPGESGIAGWRTDVFRFNRPTSAQPIWFWQEFDVTFVSVPAIEGRPEAERAGADDMKGGRSTSESYRAVDAITEARLQFAQSQTANQKRMERVHRTLMSLASEDVGKDPREWRNWYAAITGRSFDPDTPDSTPTRDVEVIRRRTGQIRISAPTATVEAPQSLPNTAGRQGRGRRSCFAAGTPVWTIRGLLPIDSITEGELVLSQDGETGALAFKPVLARTVRPAADMVGITVGKDRIRATKAHPFWIPNKGWTRTDQLQTGDWLVTLDSAESIERTASDPAPAYNLIVADFATYFVGESKILTHDVTPIRQLPRAVPGLELTRD